MVQWDSSISTHPSVKVFDPSTIATGTITFIIGRRGSGKSTALEDLMSFQTKHKHGVCVGDNRFWRKHVPSECIHAKFSDAIINDLFAIQRSKRIKKQQELGKPLFRDELEPAYAIFDGISHDKAFFRSRAIRELFMNAGSFNITVFVTCQYMMELCPSLRAQIDYLFVFRDGSERQRERLYHYFGGIFPNRLTFDETFTTLTERRHEMMVLNNSCSSHCLEKNLSYYKALPGKQYWLSENNTFTGVRAKL